MNLADNLKRIRKENNLSQEDLADSLGVSRQSVSKWESGAAYPEMDKMLQLCKMFNLNIDELLNQNIKEVKENKQNKNNINKYVDDFLDYITKTIDLFSKMTFKSKIKCLFEQIIIITIIVMVLALFGIFFMDFIRNLFRYFPEGLYFFFSSLIESLYFISGFILGAILVLHIFKIRYLNYYNIKDIVSNEEKQNNEEADDHAERPKEKILLKKKEEKIIIRDPKNTGHSFISGLFKSMVFIIKIFVSLVALMFCASLILLSAGLALSFLFIKTGITFISILIMIIASIVINILILIILYYFLINKKSNKKKLGITFAASIITFGIGLGLFFCNIFSFTYINSLDSKEFITSTKILPMNENTFFLDHWHYYIEYVESDINDLKIEMIHSNIKTIDVYEDSSGGLIITENYNPKLFKIIINDINNKKIIDYGNAKIKIYANKENILKMQENFDKQLNM